MKTKSKVGRRGFVAAVAAGALGAGVATTGGLSGTEGRSSGPQPLITAGPPSWPVPAAVPPWQAMVLEKGRHLFVDDSFVATVQNLTATLHHPQKLGKPILLGIGSGDDTSQPFATVLYDEQRALFRMWYYTQKSLHSEPRVSYIESSDGIHWERPYKELYVTNGFGVCVTDMGADEQDPARRYKMISWGTRRPVPVCVDGYAADWVAFSPDGLQWTQYEGNPVTPDLWKDSVQCDPEKKGSIKWREYSADCVHSTWDPIRKVHVAYVKSWTWPPAEFNYVSPTSNGLGQRLESVMISPDFIHWSTPVRCFVPEPDDVRSIEFGYAFRAKPRGNQMILLSSILDQGISTAKGKGTGYTVLSTTNDLVHCNRMRQPWLDRVPDDPDAADHAIAWVADMITVGDEEYIYYGSYSMGHKNRMDRTMSFAHLRKDGFVSRDAGAGGGKLVTPLIRFTAEKMTINATIRGELRLRILNADGKPLAGFREGQVDGVKGDSTAHVIKSRAKLSELKGQPVQFEFWLRDGELYAFELS